jgi:hypothetical protein
MEEERDDKKEGGFKVSDRRKFTPEGQVRDTGEPAPAQQVRETSEPSASPEGEAAGQDRQGTVKMDFSSFLLSLATTGMMHLGEIADPATGQKMDNLEGAQQMIEILAILQQKTKGNLLPEESRLLENLLYELRMKFMSKSKVIKL